MLKIQELLGGESFDDLDQETQANLTRLLDSVNQVRKLWNRPMTVTSGLRSMEKHLSIYRDKAARKLKPFENGVFDKSKVPMQSRHLYGQAVDISDPVLSLTKWLKANPEVLENAGLYCEQGNSNWVHFQIVPPKSGKRWFLP